MDYSDFEEKLMDFIDAAVSEGAARGDILSALELRVMALREELENEED